MPRLIVSVTADGAADDRADVHLNARERSSWLILAALDVPLDDLPRTYELCASSRWWRHPGSGKPRSMTLLRPENCT